jgi:hypothetical protein
MATGQQIAILISKQQVNKNQTVIYHALMCNPLHAFRPFQGSELHEPLPTFPPLHSLESREITDAHRRNYTVLTASEVPLSSYQVRDARVSTHRAEPPCQLQARAEIFLTVVCQMSHRQEPLSSKHHRQAQDSEPPAAVLTITGQVSPTWLMLPSERLGSERRVPTPATAEPSMPHSPIRS